jgi:two-component system, OmpR family, response regulator MtrA
VKRKAPRRTGIPPVLTNGRLPADFSDGRLEVSARDRVVRTDGQHLHLTPTQLGVLVELLRHRGTPRSREQLMAAVWGPGSAAGERAVDIAIARLRAQLRRRIPGIVYVHTDVGYGYRFEPQPADQIGRSESVR